MRILLVTLTISLLLFGCLDFLNFEEQKVKENKTLDFSGVADELLLDDAPEDISYENELSDDENIKSMDVLFENISLEKENITVIYFYNKSCTLMVCDIFNNWFREEKKKYAGLILFEYDTNTQEGMEKQTIFAQAYNIEERVWYEPVLYIGGRALVGAEEIRTNLSSIIQECNTKGCVSAFELLNE